MNTMPIEIDSERSRIRAALVNSGRYGFEEADEKLLASRLSVFLGEDAADTPAGQAAFLTAVVAAGKCFGQVIASGPLDRPLVLPVPLAARTLGEAAMALGAVTDGAASMERAVLIGTVPASSSGWMVQAWWNGWSAGIAPGHRPVASGCSDCALAGVAAGALAVGQAFLAEQGDLRAGRTVQGFSLWSPERGETGAREPGPHLKEVYLPLDLWLVGLGNLGQAYLWSLTLLPFPVPEDVLLLFQDDDKVKPENWGTSVLVQRGRYGDLKTRIAEEWATERGFEARRFDRRLDKNLKRSETEPAIALAGLDGMTARRLLGRPGFEYVIDCGLGATAADYQKFRVNVFGPGESPAEHFSGVGDRTASVAEELLRLPSYQQLAKARGDGGCGAAMLAQRSVAVPFVSAVVGALAITQAIRIVSGEAHHVGLTGDSGDLKTIRAALGEPPARVTMRYAPAAA